MNLRFIALLALCSSTFLCLQGMDLDVHKTDRKGRTALHNECKKVWQSPSQNKMREMLEAGANPNAIDHKGRTPLHLLVKYATDEILLWIYLEMFIQEYKADVKTVDLVGNSLLHTIMQSPIQNKWSECFFKIIQLFVKQGISAQKKNLDQKTPLHLFVQDNTPSLDILLNPSLYSTRSKYPEKIIKTLILDGNANPNVQDSNGNTPLHYVAHNSYIECVPMLLFHGANIHIKNNQKKSPSDVSNNPLTKVDAFLNYQPQRLVVSQLFSPNFATSQFIKQWKKDRPLVNGESHVKYLRNREIGHTTKK